MSTITTPQPLPAVTPAPKPPIATVPGDQRIVIRDVGWHVYETLVDSVGERQHIYVAYDGKDLEIMTKGYFHEDYRALFGRLMNAVTFELEITCSSMLARSTWKSVRRFARAWRPINARYFFASGEDREVVIAAAWARKSNDINDYPNPDLAVEIDISPSQIDRPAIFAALQVGEIWRFDGAALVIEQLRPDGSYTAIGNEPISCQSGPG